MPAHSLLFSKSSNGAARLNVPHPTDESLSTVLYAFSTYVPRKGLEFNPDVRCTIVFKKNGPTRGGYKCKFQREVHTSKLNAFESTEMFVPIDSLIVIGLQGSKRYEVV